MSTWSTPRVWTLGELLTSGNMNTYVTDLLTVLRANTGGADAAAGKILAGTGTQTSAWQDIGTQFILAGTLASRPAASMPGRLYLVTDDDGGTIFRDTGSAWVQAGAGVSQVMTGAAHASSHLPGGADAIAWSASVHMRGTLAARPAAAAANAGLLYFATDDGGGTLSRSTGSAWEDVAPGVTDVVVAPGLTNVANGFFKRNAANNAWEEVTYGSAANTVTQGNDSRLSDSRAPTGTASGDLAGTYPSPTVDGLGGQALPSNVANGFLKRNAANGAWEEVAYGSAANTVCQGNDSRLSDSRAPTGTANGDLAGTYPNPTVDGLGGQALPSNVANGFLKRNAANGAWEEVTYGTGANTICEGNDSRLGGGPTQGCSLTHTTGTTLTIPVTVYTAVPWDAEDYDTDTMHSTVTNTDRITFTTAGKYHVSCHVQVNNSNPAAFLTLRAVANGTTVFRETTMNISTAGDISISFDYAFNAGDYLTFQVGGATQAMSSPYTRNYASAHRLFA